MFCFFVVVFFCCCFFGGAVFFLSFFVENGRFYDCKFRLRKGFLSSGLLHSSLWSALPLGAAAVTALIAVLLSCSFLVFQYHELLSLSWNSGHKIFNRYSSLIVWRSCLWCYILIMIKILCRGSQCLCRQSTPMRGLGIGTWVRISQWRRVYFVSVFNSSSED